MEYRNSYSTPIANKDSVILINDGTLEPLEPDIADKATKRFDSTSDEEDNMKLMLKICTTRKDGENYTHWDYGEVLEWICVIANGYFSKYKDILQKSLKEE